MGSLVSLTLGGLEIDWGKNDNFINHSKLFLHADKTLLKIFEVQGERYEEFGYVRELRDVLPRLELLGFTMQGVENLFNIMLNDYPEYLPDITFDFEFFRKQISNIYIDSKIINREEFGEYDLGEYARKEIFSRQDFAEFTVALDDAHQGIMEFFENLHPYIQLRIFAENPSNLELDLTWHTSDVIRGGWTSEEKIFCDWNKESGFLIVTEGSTDTFIIQNAIQQLRPDIQDFFRYIDMKEHYPFSGTGNLFNFFQGLAKIGVNNNFLFIFDNDSEGIEKYLQAIKTPAPKNLRSTHLPCLKEFETFMTLGPDGTGQSDINGKAVAIECFLDLDFKSNSPPKIRWSAYKKSLDQYQGSLEGKEWYIAQFKKGLKTPDLYNFKKLEILVNHIYEECIRMADTGIT